MKLLIINNYDFHCEVIESVIVKYYEVLNISKDILIDIYLSVLSNDSTFKKYIINKYPKIKFQNIDQYDYYINCTVYDRDFEKLPKNKSNEKYISHEITPRLKTNPNVFFLTPLSITNYFYSDILPYSNNKIASTVPIFVIQGNLNQGRRYLQLLIKILDQSYKYNFVIKLVGRGTLPKELMNYKNKILLKNNLNFIDYHKQFLDAYCILPLISKKTHSQYYSTKLTSTISYARGYNLKCLIDKDLQDIYKLEHAEVFNDINDISVSFAKTLEDFYNSKK
jgi:hypothetical protein